MNLDNTGAIRKTDSKNVSGSIANLPKQLLASWTSAGKARLPKASQRLSDIIFCGMGGSNLASELLRSVYADQLRLPLILTRGYVLPAFASKNSLVIVDSYSGNTEEPIACLEQALKLKAKIICIAGGGKIEQLAKKHKLALIKLDPSLNPSGQPRYDVGSQLGAALAIFGRLKLITVSSKDISAAAGLLARIGDNLALTQPLKGNLAKQLAQRLINRSLYVVGSEFLAANAHILSNQINESAKQLASPYLVPEMNHHFLEALDYPRGNVRNSAFVFLSSPDFGVRTNKRYQATRDILDKKGISNHSITADKGGKLAQSLEILALGSWVSFYLAMLNGVDPSAIPWVDYFKKELDK